MEWSVEVLDSSQKAVQVGLVGLKIDVIGDLRDRPCRSKRNAHMTYTAVLVLETSRYRHRRFPIRIPNLAAWEPGHLPGCFFGGGETMA